MMRKHNVNKCKQLRALDAVFAAACDSIAAEAVLGGTLGQLTMIDCMDDYFCSHFSLILGTLLVTALLMDSSHVKSGDHLESLIVAELLWRLPISLADSSLARSQQLDGSPLQRCS